MQDLLDVYLLLCGRDVLVQLVSKERGLIENLSEILGNILQIILEFIFGNNFREIL